MLLFCLYHNCYNKVNHINNIHHVTLNKNITYWNNVWFFIDILKIPRYYVINIYTNDSHELLHTQMKSWFFWRCWIYEYYYHFIMWEVWQPSIKIWQPKHCLFFKVNLPFYPIFDIVHCCVSYYKPFAQAKMYLYIHIFGR